MFGGLVKAVVDIEREIMVVDAGLHSDQEDFLLENGMARNKLLFGGLISIQIKQMIPG